LRLGAGSRFVGLKLWPWTWHVLGGPPCRRFTDDWVAIDAGSPLAALMDAAPETIVARLADRLRASPPPALGEALLEETTVAAVACRAGLSHRQLQRLFARDFGMPPRSYLRLLRFRGALRGMQDHASLAEAAAAEGYADQAHMAREWRTLAGASPTQWLADEQLPVAHATDVLAA
jgi:AraC-like DNA-binding protein